MGSLHFVSSDMFQQLYFLLTYSLLPIVRDNVNFVGGFLFKWHLFVLPSAFMHCFAFSERKRYLNEEKGVIAAKEEGCYVS